MAQLLTKTGLLAAALTALWACSSEKAPESSATPTPDNAADSTPDNTVDNAPDSTPDNTVDNTADNAPDAPLDTEAQGQEETEPGADTRETTSASSNAMRATDMAETAWRVRGEDGAIYTTYFDADATYRDFKNSVRLQEGTWQALSDENKLCFTPSQEGHIGECWALAPLSSKGIMQPTSDGGRTIELRQVTYIAPLDDESRD